MSEEDHHIYFRPSAYNIEGLKNYPRARLERRDPEKDCWAIVDMGYCLNTDGEWEPEPRPSNRDEAFIERTRFPLFVAMRMVEEMFGQVDKKGEPA